MSEAHTETTPEDARANQVLEYRTLIDVSLTDLARLIPWSTMLKNSHQRSLGVLSATGADVQAEQVIKDRAAHQENLKLGVKITGPVPAPGNVNAYALQAEAQMVMRRFNRKVDVALDIAGVCLLRTTGWPNTWQGLIDETRARVRVVANPRELRRLSHDLDHLVERLTRTVDGDDHSRMGAPCPHCNQKSLIVHYREGVIRCETVERARDRHPCVCADPICGCKSDPTRERHEWHRSRGRQVDGWDHLASILGVHRQATTSH